MYDKQNLTTGSINNKLIIFAFPLLLANLLQGLYSVVDMIFVGRFVGETGLAAISNASMISFIINSICIGITMGGMVLTAQYKGREDKFGQNETVGTLFSITAVFAVIFTVLGLTLYKRLFDMLNVPFESMKDACEYMQIICFATVFVFGYNAVSSIIKGLGDSKSPLFFVFIAAMIDMVFVGIFKMGTKGAAYATALSQFISFVISVFHLKNKYDIFDFKPKSFAIKADKLIVILKVGIPAAVQMAVVNVSFLLITGMLNNFGVAVAAASGVGLKVNTFAGMPCWAVGQAVTAMVSQNIGKNDIIRVRKTVKAGLKINIAITLVAVIFVQVFAGKIIMLFETSNKEVIECGILYLRICCGINSLFYAAMYTFDSFAVGVGAADAAMVNSLLEAVVVRIIVSWLLAFVFNLGFYGIYAGQAVSPVIPSILGLVFFKSKLWEKNRLI